MLPLCHLVNLETKLTYSWKTFLGTTICLWVGEILSSSWNLRKHWLLVELGTQGVVQADTEEIRLTY